MHTESIWKETCSIRERTHLPGDMHTEVAVIGAGMAGILIADTLQDAGHKVLVLDAERIGSGQTSGTTAKITAQHGIIYHKLIEVHGAAAARQYAAANMEAIDAFRTMIAARGIDCDFTQTDAYVYGDDADTLRAEAEAAATLGLPASFVAETPLPFRTAGAVRFARQAQFHPLKFLAAAAEPLIVYEHTLVQAVEENRIITEYGTVQADHIVFACHFPFVNFPGMYFARMHQERSYVLALKNAPQIPGMWIGGGDDSYSLRTYGDLLLLGGGGHRTGENREGGRYEKLRRAAAAWFPESREAAHWSAQDCIPPDNVPYIGRYAESHPHWYVATGFGKWGMTSSMVAAAVLREQIGGEEHPCARVFDPGRFDLPTVSGVAAESGHAVKGLAKRFFQIPEETAEALPAGHGGVVLLAGEKVGVYKNRDGKVFAVDIRCPHLGCQLEWNPDEHSWDCPCHGSRFDAYGRLISGPAQEDLKNESFSADAE